MYLLVTQIDMSNATISGLMDKSNYDDGDDNIIPQIAA
jgi:hypothetical protein